MGNTRISIIAAISENRGLGKNNQLLFKIPEDFKRMKALTTGHPIIMGRKTYESIGRILPNRTNIIITRDLFYTVDGGVMASSLEDAIEKAKQSDGADEVFIFGGGEIFRQALPLTDRLYLTIVKGEYDADTFFPDYSMFTNVIQKEEYSTEDGLGYTFVDLER